MEVIGPIPTRSLTARDQPDEATLTLAACDIYLVKQATSGGETRYTAVFDASLGRRALMDLLYAVAPYKAHGPDRFSRVLDNWAIFDRAKANPTSNSLFMQHVDALKTSWQEFSRHRGLYVSIFEDQTESTRAVPILTWQRSPDGSRHWSFDPVDAEVLEALDQVVPVLHAPPTAWRQELDQMLGLVTLPYVLPELRKSWPAWQPLVKNGKSNYIGPASVPVISHMHRRALLNSVLIANAEKCFDAVEAPSRR